MDGSAFQPILESAERAVSAEDYASAESLLREAARLQTESLGPKHPALASTFNNLGIVCERANKLTDAGQFYQQAFLIASASLDSEDPLVITSRTNFTDFCRTHGMVDAAPAVQEPEFATTALTRADVVTTVPTSSFRPFSIVVAAVVAVVALGALAIWLARTPSAPGTGEGKSSRTGQPEASVSRSPSSTERTTSTTKKPVQPRAPSTETLTGGGPRLIEASLCQTLSTTGARWECTPATDSAAGGSLYFYTRIASPTSIRVHHRWYRNGALRQDLDLAVQANPSAGYRTYSRQRVDPGEWRVEAVDADGAVLRDERIAIR
jgi:tetratricopeptide repeat protein/DUF2914 family protein